MARTKKIEEPKKKIGRPVESATLAKDAPIGPEFCPECNTPTEGHAGCNHKSCPKCKWGK